MSTLGVHTPLRPVWRCKADHLPWPCPQARQLLLAAYQDAPGRSLQFYLIDQMLTAAVDWRNAGITGDAGSLYDQIIGWADE